MWHDDDDNDDEDDDDDYDYRHRDDKSVISIVVYGKMVMSKNIVIVNDRLDSEQGQVLWKLLEIQY